MSAPLIFVRDGRTLPFVPVTTAALDAIRSVCERRQLPFARSLYLALLEAANDDRSDRVSVSRKRLGEIAGLSASAITTYAQILAAAGVLEIREQAFNGERLANEYVVREPTSSNAGVGAQDDDLGAQDDGGRRSGRQPRAHVMAELQEDCGEERQERARGARPVTYRRKRVPDEVAEAAHAAVMRWAERTRTTGRFLDGNGALTESGQRVVGAMTTYPEVVELWPRMIDRALEAPWWDGPATIGVVFGPKVVEQSIARAQAPPGAAQGRNGSPKRDASNFMDRLKVLHEIEVEKVARGQA